MSEKVLVFGNNGVNKNTFHKRKQLIDINKLDIRKISNRDSYGKKCSFKYFIEYMSNIGVVSLCIKLPQLNGHTKYFDDRLMNIFNNRFMNFLVHNEKLLKVYNAIWDKISNLSGKGFGSESMIISTKIKSCSNKINTNFQGIRLPEEACVLSLFFYNVIGFHC